MAIHQTIEERVSDLVNAIRELVYLQHKNEMQINQLTHEMKEFKDEMLVFKDEMRVFRDEMKDFKDEMKTFKDEMREENRSMNKRWGEISNKLGTLVEDIVAPAIDPMIEKYFGMEPVETSIHVRKKKGDLRGEFDAIAVCEDRVFLFEVKASPRKAYITEFLEVQIPRFKALFPSIGRNTFTRSLLRYGWNSPRGLLYRKRHLCHGVPGMGLHGYPQF
jgi:hypothetical protein